MPLRDYLEATPALLERLGVHDEPFGLVYTDEKPHTAFAAKPGVPISRELEEAGGIDMGAVFGNFSCIIGNLWLARKKGGTAYISAEQYGCPGGIVYSGMQWPHLRLIEHYVSTGLPGTPMHGERYIASPEAMCGFLHDIHPPKAKGAYCVFKPLSAFTEQEPELVVLFCRPEAMTGLFMLTSFTTGSAHAVMTPFGSACSHVIGWPMHYVEKGQEVAVLGGLDPSARKYMKTDELTFTVPLSLYRKMLAAMPESLLGVDGAWPTVRKKVRRSAVAWGEEG